MGKTQLWSKMAADRTSATNMSPPTWAIFPVPALATLPDSISQSQFFCSSLLNSQYFLMTPPVSAVCCVYHPNTSPRDHGFHWPSLPSPLPAPVMSRHASGLTLPVICLCHQCLQLPTGKPWMLVSGRPGFPGQLLH